MKKKILAIAMSLIMTVTIMPQMSVNAEAKTNYKKLYGRYIAKQGWLNNDFSYAEGAFLYLDGDNIPEFVFVPGTFADGNHIYTIKKGKVKEIGTTTFLFQYVKKGNRIYESGGHTGYYMDVFYRIKNGKLKKYTSGDHTDVDTYNQVHSTNIPGDGYEFVDFRWNGKKVSKKTYNAKIDKQLKAHKWVDPKYKPVSKLGMLKYLK